jgi:hypothetical protein
LVFTINNADPMRDGHTFNWFFRINAETLP